jgi:protein-disulfide isomerase
MARDFHFLVGGLVLQRSWLAVAALVILLIGGAMAWTKWGDRLGGVSSQTAPSASAATAETVMAAPVIGPDDLVVGKAEAPVTMVEYASLTCPHCAHFANDILPQIRAAYIDKGLVKLVYRDYPLDGVALRAAMLVHCLPKDRSFAMVETLFQTQEQWAGDKDPVAALDRTARLGGLDQPAIDACIANQALKEKIVSGAQSAEGAYKVDSTPTFIIGTEKVSGAQSFEVFQKIFDAQLKK